MTTILVARTLNIRQELCKRMRNMPTIQNRSKPYQENEVYGENFATPPPDIIDGEEVYQVKTILKHRK